MIYICTKFHEIIFVNYRADTIFILIISKGHNSAKNVSGVMVLFLCTSSGDTLYLYQFHENILDSIKVIERTRFSFEKLQRGILS